MSKSPLHSRLLDLISKKEFEMLSPEEKEFISLHLSEAEYRSLRSFQGKVETTFSDENNIFPEPSVKKTLDKVFDRKYRRSTTLPKFFLQLIEFKVPAYQAALGCVATLLLASWFFHYQNYTMDSTPLLAVADTVFIEKESPARVDTVYRILKETSGNFSISNSAKQISPVNDVPNNNALREIAFPEQNMIYITDFKNIPVPGSTIREDSLPREFMVGIL